MIGGPEALDGHGVFRAKTRRALSRGPNDHVVAVVVQRLADFEGAGGVAVASLGDDVQAGSGDEGGASPAAIRERDATVSVLIIDLPIPSSGSTRYAPESLAQAQSVMPRRRVSIVAQASALSLVRWKCTTL